MRRPPLALGPLISVLVWPSSGCEDGSTPSDFDEDGWSSAEGDCDDEAPLVHPDATETCNQRDDDCNGLIDDAADADSDGFGLCDGDCDDLVSEVNPGAEEVPGNGFDENCDGSDVSPSSIGAAGFYLAGDRDDRLLGWSVATCRDVDGDGWMDLLIGGPGFDEPVAGGSAWLFRGPFTAASDGSEPHAVVAGEGGFDQAGWSVSLLGGWGEDARGALVVGAFADSAEALQAGSTYLFRGDLNGTTDVGAADVVLYGTTDDDFSGYGVAAAGDVDADGHEDLLVGSPDASTTTPVPGRAYLVRGPVDADLRLDEADAVLEGEEGLDRAGISVAGAGDVNGDGFDDLLVGAPSNSENGHDAGKAYLVLGPVSGHFDLASSVAKFVGEGEGNEAGGSVTSAGDVNADGYADLLVGAHLNSETGSQAGKAYLVFGPVEGTVPLAKADASFTGESQGDWLGWSVGAAGDIDGDGQGDVWIGAPGNRYVGDRPGRVHLFLGPFAGPVPAAASAGVLVGEHVADWAGGSISGGCDLDGGGAPDLVVGAPFRSDGGVYNGAVYIVPGESI